MLFWYLSHENFSRWIYFTDFFCRKASFDVIIISTIVKIGGVEPKIITLSQIYQEICAIWGFSLRCLATKSGSICWCTFVVVQDVGGDLVSMHIIPPKSYSININKVTGGGVLKLKNIFLICFWCRRNLEVAFCRLKKYYS